jgi:ATP-binding cassette subfamily C (CFTR/MRP) protein 1
MSATTGSDASPQHAASISAASPQQPLPPGEDLPAEPLTPGTPHVPTYRPVQQGESEHERAPWYSWPFYNWVAPMLRRGAKRMRHREVLAMDDLFQIPSFEDPYNTVELLREAWAAECTKEHPSLRKALFKTFKSRVIIGGIFRFVSDASAFAAPFILKYFILWMQSDKRDVYAGYLYAIGLAAANVFMSLTLAAASHYTLSGFTQMQNAVTVMLFDSALGYKHSHGKAGNLLGTYNSDTIKIQELALFIHGTWVSPILVVGALIAIYFFIGYAGLIGVAIMVATTPLQGILMRQVFKYKGLQLKRMDARVSAINEALQGIRICKFMNWELSFVERVQDARGAEVHVLAKMYKYRVLFQVIMTSMPQVLNFCLFAIAYAMDGGNIDASKVFPALSMLNVMRIPVMFIPMSIGKLFETKISLDRIQKVLVYNERREYLVDEPRESASKPAIEIIHATVTGDKDVVILEDVNVTIPADKLTIIVGPTASGKSSLVGSMVGEADTREGSKVVRRGSMAYVPQDAWIQNATVRNNITFAHPFDREWYIDTLIACQLMMDLKQLKASDSTSIGERGINLSGGQKQRVALARAVYSQRDIIVMDDPLSAVDPHVCRALFDRCINGVMKHRTRVLVTHQVQFLPGADHIIVMDKCQIVFQGTYADYVKSGVNVGAAEEGDTNGDASDANKVAAENASVRDIPPPQADALATAEEATYGDIPWSTYGWYVKLGSPPIFIFSIVLSLMWTAATVLFNLILSWWTSKSKVAGNTLSDNEFLMWFGIACIVCIILVAIRQAVYTVFLLKIARYVHGALMSNIVRAPMSFFDTTPIGRITNRFTKDMDVIDFRIPESSLMAINLAFNVLSMAGLVCVAAPYLTILFPFLVVIFYMVYQYYTQTVRGIKRLDGIARSPMMDLMGEVIGGLASIRVYGMATLMKTEHLRRVQNGVRPMYATRMAQRWLGTRTELLGSFIVLATGIWAVAMITNDTSSWNVSTDPSAIALALTYALATTNALTFLTRTVGELESDMSSTERVKEYCDSIPQERDVVYGTGPDQPHPPVEGFPVSPSVKFDGVDLRYRETTPLVLQHVTFDVTAGHRVGVVGRTGSGKSTLMLALFRMVEPAAGRILIDGRDIATLTLSDLRESITIIPQDPVLFSGTIRSNLDPFRRFTDEQLWAAIDQVGLRNRLLYGATGDKDRAAAEDANTEVGLDTKVLDKGSNFSVGQRQLICLARALLKKSRILLMDEATASVDFDTDALIQTTVRSAFRGATVLTIAHRLATVIDSDRILVMDGGFVKEFDSPKALLANRATQFYDMVKQLGDEQFQELKAVAEGKVAFTDKLRDLVQMEKGDDQPPGSKSK